MRVLFSIILGAGFGTILIFSEAFHWSRIQQMFHFESFHMYGLLISAIATGSISVLIIKQHRIKSLRGNNIELKRKGLQLKGNIIGGLIFGVGWAVTGACTAPIFILIGFKWILGLIVLAGALLGVIIYAFTQKHLPK